MKSSQKMLIFMIAFAMIFQLTVYSKQDNEIYRKFEKKELVKVKTLSGDCIVRQGDTDEIEVVVINNYHPRKACITKLNDDGNVLKLTEKINGTGIGGSTIWSLTVPEGTKIEFFSTSGGLSIYDLKGEFTANSASGNYEIKNCKGRFKFNTASGCYKVENCIGEFSLSSASGDIEAFDIAIDEASTVASASGNVMVKLAETARQDLNVGSASGRAILNYDGNPLRGYFEFTAKDRGGRINSPCDYDYEENFYKMGEQYVRKVFTRDSNTPLITMGTSSGKVTLRE